ncbi:MAG: ATP-dependent DNA helicase, partial [Gammaproteobacteria bacterium]|nr:ATP-dependent DNA helicase [Gammaproteobacteria bacterium]
MWPLLIERSEYINMHAYSDLLGEDGPFAQQLPGFSVRPPQQQLADAVGDTLTHFGKLIAEAGTGIGKTYAYLVPALLAHKRVIISTGTRHLQDQLYQRDLPAVRNVLGMPVRVAILKGRANYLCLHRLQLAEQQQTTGRKKANKELTLIRRWAGRTKSGEIGELAEIAESSSVWPLVTSNVENCLGAQCPQYADCHVVKARRSAQEADIVVINHHLLLADLLLKEEGFGELLPGADAIIIDEAHQLPEVATRYFSENLSSRQILDLCRDGVSEYYKAAGDRPGFIDQAQALEKSARDAR